MRCRALFASWLIGLVVLSLPVRAEEAPGPGSAREQAARAILLEEDPGDPYGQRFEGSGTWRRESPSAGSGAGPTVRCDVKFPSYGLTMTLVMQRNMDKGLPATHTIDLQFDLSGDFPSAAIAQIPGILLKRSEGMRGAPLAGLSVPVAPNRFLHGLSAKESDKQFNFRVLKEGNWFDIPLVYKGGRRGILALEIGEAGARYIAELLE